VKTSGSRAPRIGCPGEPLVTSPRLSAGVIPVRLVAGEWRFLLLRAYRYWDFPKGEVEAGEAPMAAARRETAEETGIEDLDFAWGAAYHETSPYAGGKIARYYLAGTQTAKVVLGINPELGCPEHHEARWARLDEARCLLGDRVGAALEWAHNILSQSST